MKKKECFLPVSQGPTFLSLRFEAKIICIAHPSGEQFAIANVQSRKTGATPKHPGRQPGPLKI